MDMKAVYEMPRVSFEAFMANEAVSSCGDANTQVIFDCLKGGQKDSAKVLSSALGVTCTNYDAGFADYVTMVDGKLEGNDTLTEDDNITSSQVGYVNKNHSTFSDYLQWNNNNHTVDIKAEYKSSFLGWLFISGDDKDKQMDQSGWSILNGILKFTPSDTEKKHAMLAPVFSLDIGTSL
ncbi:MAG: hypothetical protein ACI4MP_07680 [Candidatus Ventricola sp.]